MARSRVRIYSKRYLCQSLSRSSIFGGNCSNARVSSCGFAIVLPFRSTQYDSRNSIALPCQSDKRAHPFYQMLLGREMHDKIVDITARLSELALVQGDAALALAYVAEAVGQGRQLNLKLPLARALTSSGQYYLQQQNLEEARRSYTEARQILEQLGITYQVEQLTDLRARIDEEATAASETEQSRSSA